MIASAAGKEAFMVVARVCRTKRTYAIHAAHAGADGSRGSRRIVSNHHHITYLTMAKRTASSSICLATLVVTIIGLYPNTLAFSLGFASTRSSILQPCNVPCYTRIASRIGSPYHRQQRTTLCVDINDGGTVPGEAPLCDLQTFLRWVFTKFTSHLFCNTCY
jgi:hypothetical protein